VATEAACFYLAGYHPALASRASSPCVRPAPSSPSPPPESNLRTRGNGFKFYLSAGLGFTRAAGGRSRFLQAILVTPRVWSILFLRGNRKRETWDVSSLRRVLASIDSIDFPRKSTPTRVSAIIRADFCRIEDSRDYGQSGLRFLADRRFFADDFFLRGQGSVKKNLRQPLGAASCDSP